MDRDVVNNLTRYEPVTHDGELDGMGRSNDGEYVRFDDVAALLAQGAAPSQDGETAKRMAELEGEVETLRQRLEIDPRHGWDGIATRDETIKELELECKTLSHGKRLADSKILHLESQLYTARREAFEQCREMAAQVCEEMGEHWSGYKDTALLNGDVALSVAASGEPRAAEFLAKRIRALQCPEQPAAPSEDKPVANQVHELFLHEDYPLDGIDGGKPFCKFILYRDGGDVSVGEPSREYFALSKDQSDTELEDLLRRTSARKIKDFEVRNLMERHGLHHKFLSDIEVNRFFAFVRDLLKIADTPIAALAQQAGKERP